MAKPRLVLIGGDGGRSGVPSHIAHLCEVLDNVAQITVISDVDRGGYEFARRYGHTEVRGLATSVNPWAAARAAMGLRGALEGLKPDLVWAHARMALPLSRWTLRGGDMGRLMVTYHGVPFGAGHGLGKSLISRGIESVSWRIAAPHDVVFLTDEDRQAMQRWSVGGRQHVLPNCSKLGGFVPQDAQPRDIRRLVMMTRDSGQKNLTLAARIFGQLPTDFHLSLYGMGTDLPSLRGRFDRILGAKDITRVQFLGETKDVRGALAGACGLLVTSRYEGLSISMIEAMEMGLPVFSTPVGGTNLIGRVHPAFGLLDGDIAHNAAVIDGLTRDFNQARALNGAKIHAAWKATFAPEVWAQKVHSLVETVLGSPA